MMAPLRIHQFLGKKKYTLHGRPNWQYRCEKLPKRFLTIGPNKGELLFTGQDREICCACADPVISQQKSFSLHYQKTTTFPPIAIHSEEIFCRSVDEKVVLAGQSLGQILQNSTVECNAVHDAVQGSALHSATLHCQQLLCAGLHCLPLLCSLHCTVLICAILHCTDRPYLAQH